MDMDPMSSGLEDTVVVEASGNPEAPEQSQDEWIIPPGFFKVHGPGLNEAGSDEATRDDIICTLTQARQHSADEARAARRAAWTLETRREIQERRQFQEALVAGGLPELVWEEVLGRLSSQQKAQMSRMNWLWWHAIKLQRTQFLFHQVYPIFVQGGYLGRTEVLNFRLVSKGWKESLESHLQNSFFKGAPKFSKPNNEPESVPDVDFPMSFQREAQQITRFLDWSSAAVPPAGNPFPSRKLVLGVPSGSNRDLWAGVHPLLERWGREVWQVAIYLDGELESFNDTYMELRTLLTWMPNLRALGIWGNDRFRRRQEFEELRPQEASRRTGNLLRDNPLPEMPQLKILITANFPNMLSRGVLDKYGPLLETYSISGKLHDFSLNVHFPRLREFYLISDSISLEESELHGDWSSLEDLRVGMQVDTLENQQLFKMLNRFGGTLRRLQLILLKGSRPEWVGGGESFSLELPNVVDFSLILDHVSQNTIDFMLPLIKLKYFLVKFTKILSRDEKEVIGSKGIDSGSGPSGSTSLAADEDGPATIQFWDRYDRLYDSNLWTLFPELNTVRVVVTVIQVLRLLGPRVREIVVRVEDKLYTREGFANAVAASKAVRLENLEA